MPCLGEQYVYCCYIWGGRVKFVKGRFVVCGTLRDKPCEDRSNRKRQRRFLRTLREDWTAQFVMRELKWFLQCGVITVWVLKLFLLGKKSFRFVFRPNKKGSNSLLLRLSLSSAVEARTHRETTKPRLQTPLCRVTGCSLSTKGDGIPEPIWDLMHSQERSGGGILLLRAEDDLRVPGRCWNIERD